MDGWMDGVRSQEVMFNGFWGWRIFRLLLLPDMLMCHRCQEVPGARFYLLGLALQARLDLLENHHGHL